MFEIKIKVLILVGECVKVINSTIYYGYLVALKLINKNEQISNKKEMFVKSFKFSILNEWMRIKREKRKREKKVNLKLF